MVAITGGARGIGAATAAALRAKGAHVVIGDLDPPDSEALPLDVTSRESFGDFLDAVRERYGRIDVLINNAGVLRVGSFLDEDDLWAHRMMDINVHGVLLGMKLVLPEMIERGSGHVVNIASAASRIGVRNEATYTASKHAVYGATDAVRQEIRGSGVELSLIMPGLVRTELAAGTLDGKNTVVLTPEAVADAIVATLERPRFDVYVPKSYGTLFRILSALPRPARERLLRLVGSERATEGTTAADRAAYEQRIEELTAPNVPQQPPL